MEDISNYMLSDKNKEGNKLVAPEKSKKPPTNEVADWGKLKIILSLL